MEVFTIVANEVIGLSATECTLMQFSYNPEQIHDPESVLRSAVMDYLKTDEGKRQLEINCGCWNWGDVMKNEFKKVSSPQERHDYVVYKMHEDILNQRYHESVQTVLAELKKVIPRIELTGQWSVDVMRNGNDYYIIDMALAENSALNDCVPKNLLRAYPQQWLPGESNS